eukprot:3369681-Amphidinium_carterae.1
MLAKQLYELTQTNGGKPANWGSRRSDKVHGKKSRGGGKRAGSSNGWSCKSCNFGYKPVCFACKQAKAGKDSPGVPAKNQKPASPNIGNYFQASFVGFCRVF